MYFEEKKKIDINTIVFFFELHLETMEVYLKYT